MESRTHKVLILIQYMIYRILETFVKKFRKICNVITFMILERYLARINKKIDQCMNVKDDRRKNFFKNIN